MPGLHPTKRGEPSLYQAKRRKLLLGWIAAGLAPIFQARHAVKFQECKKAVCFL